MDLDSSQIYQLAGALLGAVIIFVLAYAAPLRVSVAVLLVLIPFQPVATTYGSANVVMTFVLAGALIVRGRLTYMPMLGTIFAVIFAYLVTVSQLPKSIYVLHGVEVLALVSGFLVFLLAYNLARDLKNPSILIDILLIGNVLSILYCLVQFFVTPGESLELFGVKEMALNKNRGDGDARLVGPFGTAGITAAYFMSMTLILMYEAVSSQGKRKIVVSTITIVNVAVIIATANRGSFLVLLAGALWFLYLFREKLGFARIVQILVVASVLLVGIATVVVSYTRFDQMFDRLARTTETEEGLPETRAVAWPRAWEDILEKPLIGHGPRLVQQHEKRFRRLPDEQLISRYPHNLYLYLLLTVGVIGASLMLFFLVSVVWRIYQGAKRGTYSSEYEKGLVMMGFVVAATFLIDELKIEFLRSTTVDYAHFIFAIFGIFLGWADRGRLAAHLTQDSTAADDEMIERARLTVSARHSDI